MTRIIDFTFRFPMAHAHGIMAPAAWIRYAYIYNNALHVIDIGGSMGTVPRQESYAIFFFVKI
jgi:hypothetical protein